MEQIRERLMVIVHLCSKEGWYDGEGVAITEPQITAFLEMMDKLGIEFPEGLVPFVYPTPEGELRFEWDIWVHVTSLDINLHTYAGYFLDAVFRTGDKFRVDLPGLDTEDNYDLSREEEWRRLIKTLTSYERISS